MCLNPHTKIWRKKNTRLAFLATEIKMEVWNIHICYSLSYSLFIVTFHCFPSSFHLGGIIWQKNRIFCLLHFQVAMDGETNEKSKKIVFLCSLSSSQCTRGVSRRDREMRAIICVLKHKWQCGEAVRIFKKICFFCWCFIKKRFLILLQYHSN